MSVRVKYLLRYICIVCMLSPAINIYSVEHGIKGGGSVYQRPIKSSDYIKDAGIMVGWYFKIPLGNRISIQPEILYSKVGYQSVYNNVDKTKASLKENHLIIPILFNYDIFKGINIQAGGSYNYLASTRGEVYQFNTSTPVEVDNINKRDLLLNLGVEYNSKLGFIIGGRYNRGIIKQKQTKVSNNNEYSSFVQVYIGLKF